MFDTESGVNQFEARGAKPQPSATHPMRQECDVPAYRNR